MRRTILLLITIIFYIGTNLSVADTIKVHCRDFPPEIYFEGNKCVGVLPDLVTDIFIELGHELVWTKVPWIRSIKDAKTGKVDLLIRHSMIPERTLFLAPIEYVQKKRTLYYYKSPFFQGDITSYDALTKVRVGAIRGNFYSANFSLLDTQWLTLIRETEQLVAMLERGRIDIAVTSSAHGIKQFVERFEKVTFEDTFFNPMYISIPKTSKAIKYFDEVSALMLHYRKSGKINQYYEKYGLVAPKQTFDE